MPVPKLLSGEIISKSTTGRRYFPSLDGVRGMAFLFVLASHISNERNFVMRGSGKIGVWLFFILSSFLLTHYFVSRPERARHPQEWLNYLVRRFLRVYPLYALVVSFDYLVVGTLRTPADLIDHLLLTKGYDIYWTIPVEMKYYLVLPVVVIVILLLLRRNLVLALAALAGFIWIFEQFVPASATDPNSAGLLPYLPVFISGSVLSLVYMRMEQVVYSKQVRLALDGISLLMLAAVCLTAPGIWSLWVQPVANDVFFNQFILYGIAWAVFILTMLSGEGYVRRFFEHPVLRFVGKISFGAYLTHLMILYYFDRLFPQAMLLVPIPLTIITTLVTAYILHVLVERPCMRVNLIKRPQVVVASSPGIASR